MFGGYYCTKTLFLNDLVLKLYFILKVDAVMTRSLEEDVTLECPDSDKVDQKAGFRGRWIKYSSPKEIIWPGTTKGQHDRWMKWRPGEDGHMSLHLSKLKQSDEGLYGCEIWKDWDLVYGKNISLKLKGKICRFISTSLVSQRTNHRCLSSLFWVMASFRMQKSRIGGRLIGQSCRAEMPSEQIINGRTQ